MRIKITALLAVLLLVACSPEETVFTTMAPPEASTTTTPTATIPPPTVTVTSTATPFMEIIKRTPEEVDQLEAGTYLVYPEEIEDGYALTFIKSDASIKVSRAFPLIFEFYSVEASIIQGVSPDGRYYAYLSGHKGDWMSDYDLDEEYELQLNIVSLRDQSIVAEFSLLSDSFPANFLEYAQNHQDQFESEFEQHTPESIAQELFYAFKAGMGTFQWSPNGRYLAFAGQMEGLSSDLYVFDVANRSVRRLTSGPEQIQSINWSPDGQHIAHASTNVFGSRSAYTNHIASLDGSRVISFPDHWIRRGGWLNNNQYLAYNKSTGAGNNHLILYDTIEGSARAIWPRKFSSVSYLDSRNLLLVNLPYPEFTELEAGIYLVDPLTEEYSRIADGEYWSVQALDREDYVLVLEQLDEGIYLLSADYKIEKISEKIGWTSASPDNELIAIYDYKNDVGLDIYWIDDQTTLSIVKDEIRDFEWLPDSSGFFLEIGESFCLHDLISGSTIEVGDSIEYFGFSPYEMFVEIE